MIKDKDVIYSVVVTRFYSGYRLDRVLSGLLSSYSRSQIKNWILQKKVRVNDFVITVPKKKVFEGSLIEVYDIFENIQFLEAENIPLDIIYEDDFILVINKPSNFVVHPGIGNTSGTLLNALLYRYPTASVVPRAGIVQRLDKDTTGLLLIAKDIFTQNSLIKLFRLHKIIREYEAVVFGNIVDKGTVNQPIARNVMDRTCMSVYSFGKPAITHYQVIENFSNYTRIKLQLETGRTHQIRVHMAYIRHPVIGDQKYGNSKNLVMLKKKYQISNDFSFCLNRQALHASMLEFSHPVTGVRMRVSVSLPSDMMNLLGILRFDSFH